MTMSLESKIEEILPHISKPSRYVTGEFNSIIKDQKMIDFRFALAFPDAYEIGMSHLGIPILYEILNRLDRVQAERVFAPWIDMADTMKEEGIPLFSYETLTPINEFDVLGFSLQYELCYTNVLMMLDLAGIPLLSKERTDTDPIVIAGGPCVFNPEPMVDFIDAFVIGEAEDAIVEIVEALKDAPKEREGKLRALHKIDGIYVPKFYETERIENGTVVVKGTKIKKRFVKDLNSAVFPTKPVVPYMPAIHDRIKVEVLRGCTQGCRFCQAGIIYRPARERSLDKIKNFTKESIDNTGYEELSLVSLSTCDHSQINDMVRQTVNIAAPRHVGVSFPSSRVDSFSIELAEMVQSIRKTGLTFAPESGNEQLRAKINKPISNSELLSKCEEVYARGWNLIKLYFMIGLPMETDEDVNAIGSLAQEVIRRGRRRNQRANLNLSVSTFIPKPHTPFQWSKQNSIEETECKQQLLRESIRDRSTFSSQYRFSDGNKRIKLKPHPASLSFLEGAFSRGDRRLGKVILKAYQLGCRFDGWKDQFKFDRWMDAFDKCGIDPKEYLRKREIDEPLPWEHIDTLVKKEFLLNELKRASNGEITLDCRKKGCIRCGIGKYYYQCALNSLETEKTRKCENQKIRKSSIQTIRNPQSEIRNRSAVQKIRIQFAKTKLLRFLSHLETLNVITRALQRQRIPVAFSRGFHPRPKISFSSPTSVGIISIAEFADIELYVESNPCGCSLITPHRLMTLLNETLPDGLQILKAREIPKKVSSLMSEIQFTKYRIQISNAIAGDEAELIEKIESVMNSEEIWINRVRGNKVKKVDLRKLIKRVEFIGKDSNTTTLECVLRDGASGKGKPREIAGLLLELNHSEQDNLLGLKVVKVDSYIPVGKKLVSPMDRDYTR